MPRYLTIFFWYSLFITTFLGVSIVYFFDFDYGRLTSIGSHNKSLVFFHTLYSILVIGFVVFVLSFVDKSKTKQTYYLFINSSPHEYKNLALVLLLLNFIYQFIIIVLYGNTIPLVMFLSGENIGSVLLQAKSVHFGLSSFNLPYISKFFDFLNYFLPLLFLLLFLRKSIGFILLLISYFFAFFYFSMDFQKAPFLIICLMTCYLVIILSTSLFKLLSRGVIVLAVVGLVVYLYSFFMGKNFLDMLLYLLDRPIFGQIQGMYFLYEFYQPSMDAFWSKFMFSGKFGIDAVPPDVFIVDYVYPNSDHVVNVNSYFLGEAWSFGGELGVILFSILVAISIGFYIVFWNYANRTNVHLNFLMALVFFSTLPVNQSLQFIIFQKYFLYFIVFFVIPMFFLTRTVKRSRR